MQSLKESRMDSVVFVSIRLVPKTLQNPSVSQFGVLVSALLLMSDSTL
jgi:hypothetical protein